MRGPDRIDLVLIGLAAVLAITAVTPGYEPTQCLAAEPDPTEAAVIPTAIPDPTEQVVPVPTRTAGPWPTAISGAPLAWPRLQQGVVGPVSHYGSVCPSCVALPYPWGEGWRVVITGPAGTWEGVSNDMGPERRLRRVADLGLPVWQRVCGLPASAGLCTATVLVLGRDE